MSDLSIVAKMEFMDLMRYFKAHDYSEDVSATVADYLTSCVDYELDLNNYVWNVLPFFVVILNSKEEALKYVEENLCCELEDCKIYETENGKCYLEWC